MQEIQVWFLHQKDSSGGENDNTLQYSFLENPVDREAWRATAHRVTKSQHDLGTEQEDTY